MMKINLIPLLLLLLLSSCKDTVTGHFYFGNGSQVIEENNKKIKDVKLTVLLNEDTVFNQNTKSALMNPDTMYHRKVLLVKGPYILKVLAEEENLKLIDTIYFTSDKWIHISYLADKEDTFKDKAVNQKDSKIKYSKGKSGNKTIVLVKDKNKTLILSLQHKKPKYL
jgi:hypothetical protein